MTFTRTRLTLYAALAGAAALAGVLFGLAALSDAGSTRGGVASANAAVPGDSQSAALADGVVTDAEYAGAVESMVTCIQGLGIATEPAERLADGRWVYPYGGARSIDELNKMEERVNKECKDQLLNRVEQAWLDSREFHEAALIRGDRVLACMGQAGHTFAASEPQFGRDLDAARQDAAAWDACIAEQGGGVVKFRPKGN